MNNSQVLSAFAHNKSGSSALLHSDGSDLFYKGLLIAEWSIGENENNLCVCPLPTPDYDRRLFDHLNLLFRICGSSYRVGYEYSSPVLNKYNERNIVTDKLNFSHKQWLWITGPNHGKIVNS